MTISTRPSTPADTDFARATHHAAYHDVVVAQFGSWDDDQQDRFFAKDWSNAEFGILLYDGVPCGYAAVEDRPGDVHVRELVIAPARQGRGVGTTFLRSVMERAARRSVPVHLGTFRCNRALALYQRLEFREVEHTTTHVILEWGSTDHRRGSALAV